MIGILATLKLKEAWLMLLLFCYTFTMRRVRFVVGVVKSYGWVGGLQVGVTKMYW